jgi:hypothetical protein
MAVSKRIRFEVLRRDGHACRYCGAMAPDAKLHVDHVMPVALGGSDEPDNLVTACIDCNAGKASTSPDAPIVADVADDQLRWARAMEAAAAALLGEQQRKREVISRWLEEWEKWSKIDYLPEFRYFCGICHTQIRELNDKASELVREEAAPDGA